MGLHIQKLTDLADLKVYFLRYYYRFLCHELRDGVKVLCNKAAAIVCIQYICVNNIVMQSEFQFIASLKEKYALSRVGDDCAVLPSSSVHDLVITADMLVENVDFRLEWMPADSLGHKALAVSLSDIAAMGAQPEWAMVSLAVPADLWNDGSIERFYEGWFRLARNFGVELVGGDISRTVGPLVVDSIVGGRVQRGKAIFRSNARPGDSIYVTGSLGGAAGGLRLLEVNHLPQSKAPELIQRQIEPHPQLKVAKLLQEMNIARAMIDISDGLSSDLGHICSASEVGANIYADSLPVDPNLAEYFGSDECIQMALNGGEDFELLFTSCEKNISLPDTASITLIGEVTANAGIIELIGDGKTSIITPKGYRHF
jgi:thiamine-monophosphate kinase